MPEDNEAQAKSDDVVLTKELAKSVLSNIEKHIEPGDYQVIKATFEKAQLLSDAIQTKGISVRALRQIACGNSTEVAAKLFDKKDPNDTTDKKGKDGKNKKDKDKPPPPGHGRKSADDYTGAKVKRHEHDTLNAGDPCPECDKGKLRNYTPGVIINITADAPLTATRHEQEKLRCDCCDKIFSAAIPKEAIQEKYDAKARSMIAHLRYGTGLPHKRLETLQGELGVPLPSSTQWDQIHKQYQDCASIVFETLQDYAAQGSLLHSDDTRALIIEILKQREHNKGSQKDDGRTGIFTTGIVAQTQQGNIYIFNTGTNHAGENMDEILAKRKPGADPPLLMSDALSRNTPKSFKVILSNCMTHARRNFVNIAAAFPHECYYIIEKLGEVYKNDEHTKKQNMTPEQRLSYHQQHSAMIMEEQLKLWMQALIDEKKAEPNGALYKAMDYILKRWDTFTQFLYKKGAPLDNNICERALKKAIIHRKNSLYYRTNKGALVGDCYMSIIHTCKAHGVNPFNYLVEIENNAQQVQSNPQLWMPWNFQMQLP